MGYCTQAQLETIVGATLIQQLTDDELSGSGNAQIAVRVAKATLDASAVIDGFLRLRYTVPLASPVPALITKLSQDLSLFELHRRREHEVGMPAGILQAQQQALSQLKAMRDGDMDLGVEPPPAASSATYALADSDDVLFSDETLEEF